MELNSALRSIIEASVVLPIGLISLLSFIDKLRLKTAFVIPIMVTCFSTLSVFCGVLRLRKGIKIGALEIASIILMFAFLMMVTKENPFKVLFVISTASALVFTGSLFGYYLEAYYNKDKTTADPETQGLILRFAFVAVLMIIFSILLPKVRWFLNCPEFHKIWKILWLVPVAFSIANLVMIPHQYKNFSHINIFITVTTIQLVMHLLFLFLLYFIAVTVTEKSKLDKQSQMLSIQATQYEALQRHIEATSKLRHDFKHTVRTAVSLASEGNNEALVKLLSDYGVATAHTDKRIVFTKNSTLNALICHYYETALSKSIICDWQVRLPEALGIEDIDIFGVIGNLLENAIHASENESAENRYIKFKADFEDNGDLYIVTTNGFNGVIKKEKDKYISTKATGSGIGIESIRTIVKRYNGYVSFYNDDKTFFADVMLKQNQKIKPVSP